MIANRKHHRMNACLNGDVTPDRIISRADRVQMAGGWRGFFELGAVEITLQAIPTVNIRLKAVPTVSIVLGSKP